MELCPYCKIRPLTNKSNAVTCGDPGCQIKHSKRDVGRKTFELCPYCKIRPLSNRKDAKTCGDPVCHGKNNRKRTKNRHKTRGYGKHQDELSLAKSKPVKRKCLKCDSFFETKTGDRICPRCHEVNAAYASEAEGF